MPNRTTTIVPALAGAFILMSGALSAADGYCSQPAMHGDRIVFVSEGDLWIASLGAPAAAGATERVTAHRLTNGPGLESNPVISPDGTRVAFSAEYEGNRDVYVMPLAGGLPERITFHPDPDQPLAWSPDGARIAFRSPRLNPLGRPELFWVGATGGIAEPAGFGECSMIAFDRAGDGSRFAFCRWSNETWNWKRYRGGTAPEIWIGDLAAKRFANGTNDHANDLFPMWIGERIWFASDRDGSVNLWSMRSDGSDVQQATRFANDASRPTDPQTYELRWPSADAGGAPRIIFAQAGELCVFNINDGSTRRFDIDLISDRVGTRQRFVSALANASDFSLSPSGDRLLIEARGELLSLPVGKPKDGRQVGPRQLTRESTSREWGAVWLSERDILCVTDAGGEQQLAQLPADGSSTPQLLTTDRSQWLLRPVASPDGRFVAFADKTLRLWLFDVAQRTAREIDRSEAGEILEYSFSPDGAWLAYSKPMMNANNWIRIRSTSDDRVIDISDGLTHDREPVFDPRGRYLWYLSDRHLNPIISGPDFEHVFTEMTEIMAVPLARETPPPSMTLAAAAGFDLKAWAEPVRDRPEGKHDDAKEGDDEVDSADDADDDAPIAIDAEGIRARIWRVPVEPGMHRSLVATAGGVWFLTDPVRGIADVEWPTPPLGEEIATLSRFAVLEGEAKRITDGIASFAASEHGSHVAWMKDGAFHVLADGGEKPESVDMSAVQIAIDPRGEWSQMLDESWRLQRDYFWAETMVGVNWPAMRERYRALLPKVGTRSEFNDLLGQLLSELGTSHTYVMGGDEPDRARPIGVGVLGASLRRAGNAVTIDAILPGRPGDVDLLSPLALPHLGVAAGSVLLSIDGRAVRPDRDPYELLQDRAGRVVVLEIADDAQGNNRRSIETIALDSERPLRYAHWVDSNRAAVESMSEGRVGYVHVPDMDSAGLIEFSRTFYAQLRKDAMIVDIRDNGGGWISQQILARVARKPWAYMAPRHGRVDSYPAKVLHGPFAVLIDQNAGSDGDIFPASVRLNGIAPLIGTRTWGGVVGIRGDKPAVDLMVTTQPEFAWFDPTKTGPESWNIENEGVAPDIEIDTTPLDRLEGRDPQLAKGVEVLLESIRTKPVTRPNPPPFPDRSRVR